MALKSSTKMKIKTAIKMMMTRTPLYDEPHSSSFAMSLLERVILAIFFASIVIFISLDLFTDSLEGVSVAHLSTELIVAGIGGVGLLYLIWSGFRFRGQLVSTRRSLEEVSADAALFKKDSEKWVQGLGMVIDQQLSKWNLTETEKEVALLLLKGLSSKEIAAIRNKIGRAHV